jgi:hypothetical protein
VQGFEEGSYDMIIASNVLHATKGKANIICISFNSTNPFLLQTLNPAFGTFGDC